MKKEKKYKTNSSGLWYVSLAPVATSIIILSKYKPENTNNKESIAHLGRSSDVISKNIKAIKISNRIGMVTNLDEDRSPVRFVIKIIEAG